MNINCFIIEDEPLAIQILESYIEKTPFLKTANKISFIEDAVDIIRREKPDLIFLDINANGIGKYYIEELSRKQMVLIFTTAHPKTFIEETLQINLSGLGYLHKPISYDSFIKEVERMIE